MPLIGLAPDTFTWLHPGGDGGDDVDDWVASLTIMMVLRSKRLLQVFVSPRQCTHHWQHFRGGCQALGGADLSNLPLPQYHLILH